MSSNDHGRKFDTALAEAFRRAGYDLAGAQVPSDDLKSGSRSRLLPIAVSGHRQTPATLFGAADLPKLDLHGCNEDQAHEGLEAFIRARHREGRRKVLVITGKGSGKLRRLVPLWLEARPFKEFVANACIANPWDGGEGALYVHLHERRMRIS